MIYRAFFAIPSSFQTSRGLPTNATYGFALMFRKVLAGRQPRLGAVVFDTPGPTFRDRRYPEYKAHRPRMAAELRQQIPWTHKVVEAHDFPTLRVEGYEADDVIGTLTREALEQGHEVHIISADKDFAQLIGDDVRMIDTMRDITYDAELVRKKWGVPPAQIVDLFALVGDKVDNVPGVPGIGQKGAAKLLAEHGSLDGLLAALDQLKGRARTALSDHRDLAVLSRDLVVIEQRAELPVRLEELAIPDPDPGRLDALYRELEFYSLLTGEGEAEAAEVEDRTFDAARTLAEVEALVASLGEHPAALVGVHEAPSFVSGELVGLAIATSPARATFVPLRTSEAALGAEGLARLRPWLEDPAQPKLVHDGRDLYTLLARHGVTLAGVTGDAQLASFLADPTKIIPHRLDQVVREFLHRTIESEKGLVGSGQKTRPFGAVPLDDLARWAGQRASAIHELWPAAKARMEAADQGRFYEEVELPLSWVLGRMQLVGIRADGDDLDRMNDEFEARKARIEAHIYELAGREFNIGSTKQLAEVLFEDLELPVLKRTKTGYSTAADVLERLAAEHPIAREVLRQRALAKLINTYTRVLKASLHPRTGRIHCTIQQTTGSSGRLITTDPDLQRTPIRTDDGVRIRQAFIPRDGWVLISADWSQIELRILAHVSGDPLLGEAFREGIDIHRRTASQLFDVAPEDVTAAQRDVGKTVNFATIYGQGATALAQQLSIERAEAKGYIDRYFERYREVRRWSEEVVADAYRDGYVTTLLGRRRYVPELSSNNVTDRSYGERIAVNTPIQGSAADLCKVAMLRIAEDLEAREAELLLQIHDELIVEAPPGEVDAVEAVVRGHMETAVELDVPLAVDIGHGASWAEAKA